MTVTTPPDQSVVRAVIIQLQDWKLEVTDRDAETLIGQAHTLLHGAGYVGLAVRLDKEWNSPSAIFKFPASQGPGKLAAALLASAAVTVFSSDYREDDDQAVCP